MSKSLYKPPIDKHSEKYRTYALVAKRNAQFHTILTRLKDPVTILEAHALIHEIYIKYFGKKVNAADWIRVLLYSFDRSHFFVDDVMKDLGYTRAYMTNLFKSMGKRHLLTEEKSGTYSIYRLSPDGHLFLSRFSKECTSAMMSVVRKKRIIVRKVKKVKK